MWPIRYNAKWDSMCYLIILQSNLFLYPLKKKKKDLEFSVSEIWEIMQVMQEESRQNTFTFKDFAIYRKIKNLNEKGLSKHGTIFQKCMFQGITNTTRSLLEPNFTSSHNAVDHGDDLSNSYSIRENLIIKPGKWMRQQAGEKGEYRTDAAGKGWHIFEKKPNKNQTL